MRITWLWLCLTVCFPLAPASAQSLRLTPKLETPTDGYDQVLARFAKPSGFDYAGLAADADAKRKLEAFVSWAANMEESAPLADWLNTYNALVLSSVLSKLPLASVMDDKGFFKENRRRVAGKSRSLDEIENDVIRPRFHDARVHFALNCAAKSCPTLYERAFRSESLEATLDTLTRKALSDDRNLSVSDSELLVTPIFVWFETDFVRDAGSVRAFLRKFSKPSAAQRISDSLPIKARDYDWSLNRLP